MRRISLLLTFLVGTACGGGAGRVPTAPSRPVAASEFATYDSARLSFRYLPIDAATVVQTAASVEREVDRILEDIGVATMPRATVTLYPNGDALRQAVGSAVGAIPSFATGLVASPTAIHIISPNVPATWSYTDGVISIVHEFAHCVTLVANPSFANNPRWLWESAALFEAGQYVDPGTYFMSGGAMPSLAQLSGVDYTIVYSVGASLGQFIVERRGLEAYRRLIRANGDLDRVLGTTEPAFLADWRAYVREVFGIARATGGSDREQPGRLSLDHGLQPKGVFSPNRAGVPAVIA